MKKIVSKMSIFITVVLVCTLLYIPALAADTVGSELIAKPVNYTLTVDSKDFAFWVYEINGDAYFKLRDLAMVLKDTEKRFTVDWMENRNAMLLDTDKSYSYTPVGGELSQPSTSEAQIAQPAVAFFYLDGKRILINSYIVNGAHYISLSDFEINMRFTAVCNKNKHTAEIDTAVYNNGLYSFFVPDSLSVKGDFFDLTITSSGEWVTSMTLLAYDPSSPITQLFAGNHRETLSSGSLSGLEYPAAKAVIRVTQPAAAQDDSYVDELHLYVILADLGCAFDFSFDSAKVEEQTAMDMVKSLKIDKQAFEKNSELRHVLFQWIAAVHNGDGKAQYELMSTRCKAEFYDYYESLSWSTDASASWLKAYTADVVGNRAIIHYGGTKTDHHDQILTFIIEDGCYLIDTIDNR